jgi:hypothetical protein
MPAPAWAPTLAQVAALIPTLTRPNAHDGTAGEDALAATFTADTTPTATQVTELITQQAAVLTTALGADPAAGQQTTAAAIVAMRVAGLVLIGMPGDEQAVRQGQAFLTAATADATQLLSAVGGAADSALPTYWFPALAGEYATSTVVSRAGEPY